MFSVSRPFSRQVPFLGLVLTLLVGLLSIVGSGGGGGGGGDGGQDTTPPTVTATPPGGNYAAPQTVTLSANEAATIYYTLDGSTPAVGGAATLSGASPISNISIGLGATQLRFFAVDTAGNQSAISSETYSILSDNATWVGSYGSDLLAETPVAMELTQLGASVSGTYTDAAGNYGTVSATVTGSNFTLTVTSSNPACPGSYTGSGSSVGETLVFTFTGSDCLGVHTGGVGSVTRQVGNLLTYGQQTPTHLVVQSDKLYWSDASETPLQSIPVSGGTAQPLARKIGVPVALTVANNKLYWVDARSGIAPSGCVGDGVWQVLNRSDLDGTNTETLAVGDRCAHENPQLLVDADNAYWLVSTASPNTYTLQKVPLDGSATADLATSITTISALTKDAGYLYWQEQNFPDAGSIKRLPLAGGSSDTLYTADSTHPLIGNLALQGSELVFADIVYPYQTGGYRLQKLDLTNPSATPTLLASVVQSPVPLQITTDSSAIYGVDAVGVFSLPLTGGSVTPLASTGSAALELRLDGSDILWTESDGSLYSVPADGSAAAQTLASGLLATGAFVINGSNIAVAEGSFVEDFGQVVALPRTGGATTPLLTGISTASPPLAVDASNAYVADGWRVKKVPLSGSGVATVQVEGNDSIEDVAQEGGYIYWLEGGAIRVIKRMPVGGGSVETLASTSEFVEQIATDSSAVYWVEGYDTIQRVANSGGTVSTVASGLAAVSDLLSDGSHVYFSEQDAGRIRRVPVGGGTIDLLTGQPLQFSWIALASDADNIYWLDQQALGKVAKAGGTDEVLIPDGMQTDATRPGGIAVDASQVYWTETAGGTIKSNAK